MSLARNSSQGKRLLFSSFWSRKMSSPCTIEYKPSTDPYYFQMTISYLALLCLVVLVIHTLYNERAQRKKSKFKRVRGMHSLYFALQIVALYWLIVDLFRFSIDPFTQILQNSVFCKIAAYSLNYLPGIYYGLFLSQILHRLVTSFKGSYLELPQWCIYTLFCMVLLVPIVSTVSLIIDNGDLECIKQWNPSDMDRTIEFCVVPPDSLLAYKYHIVPIVVVLINALNICFGVIFTVKLREFMSSTISDDSRDSRSQKERFKFEALVVKNQILTIVGIVSTTGWKYKSCVSLGDNCIVMQQHCIRIATAIKYLICWTHTICTSNNYRMLHPFCGHGIEETADFVF